MKYKLNLKTSYDDLTVGDYQKLMKLPEDASNIQLLSVLSDRTKEELEGFPLRIINEAIKETDFIHDDVPDTSPTEPVTIEGHGWEITQDIEDLTAGQFISLVELTKEGKTTENLHLILALILNKYKLSPWWKFWKKWERIPYTKRDTKSIMSDSESIKKHFPLKNGIAISSFFFSIYDQSPTDTEAYFRKLQTRIKSRGIKEVTQK